MHVAGASAMVTGGAGGLGEASVRRLAEAGARIAICDLDRERGQRLADELGERARFVETDVTSEESVAAAVDAAAALGPLRIAVSCHGGPGGGGRTVSRDGAPHDLASFKRTLDIFLTGTFNVLRLAAAAMAKTEPQAEGERGIVVNTASIAGYEGTIAQLAYAAAKGGVIGMTLVAARDLSPAGVRAMPGRGARGDVGPARAVPAADGSPAGVRRSRPAVLPELVPERRGHPARRRAPVRAARPEAVTRGSAGWTSRWPRTTKRSARSCATS